MSYIDLLRKWEYRGEITKEEEAAWKVLMAFRRCFYHAKDAREDYFLELIGQYVEAREALGRFFSDNGLLNMYVQMLDSILEEIFHRVLDNPHAVSFVKVWKLHRYVALAPYLSQCEWEQFAEELGQIAGGYVKKSVYSRLLIQIAEDVDNSAILSELSGFVDT